MDSRQRSPLAALALAALLAPACEAEPPAEDGDSGGAGSETSTEDGAPGDGGAAEPDLAPADGAGEATDEVAPPADVDAGSEVLDASPDTDAPVPPADAAPADTGGPTLPEGAFSLECVNDLDCKEPCATGVCAFGTCKFDEVKKGCLLVDGKAGHGRCLDPFEPDPATPCLLCNPAIATTGVTSIALTTSFEPSEPTFESKNLSGSAAKWTVVDARASAGAMSLYFGDPDAKTYDVGDHAWGRVETPAFPIAPGATPVLSFGLWLETEETPGFDVLRVLAVSEAGVETVLWTSDEVGGTTGGAFVPVVVPVSDLGGGDVAFAFEFDSVDALINGYEGAYVDQVKLQMGCCAGPADCQDGDPCTIDYCPFAGEPCEHKDISGCCNGPADCDDGNECTKDVCSGAGGSCLHQPIAGCCFADKDCDDGNPCNSETCVDGKCKKLQICCKQRPDCEDGDKCTSYDCVAGTCVYTPICCTSDAECDDFDLCTFETCFDGKCVYTASGKPGCCETAADCDDGDFCTKDSCDASIGLCSHSPVKGCCHDAGECDDKNPATTDDCVSTQCFNCGDGVCSAGEKCDTCQGDCGDCAGPNSCVGKCGGSSTFCYCDDACVLFGDCCADACAVCGKC